MQPLAAWFFAEWMPAVFRRCERVTQIINGGRTGWKTPRSFKSKNRTGVRNDMGLETFMVAAQYCCYRWRFRHWSFTRHQQSGSESRPAAHRRKAAATEAAAERRVEATKEASNVQQTVNHMPDDDVDRELRETGPVPVVVDTPVTGLNQST
jgi:hypothetical protein